MKLLILFQVVCFLALVDARRHSKRGAKTPETVVDRYVRYASHGKTTPLKKCIDTCARKADVPTNAFSKSATGGFATPEELEALCGIQECIDSCSDNEVFAKFVKFVCNDTDYAASVECLNENYQNASVTCLIEHYEKIQGGGKPDDEKAKGGEKANADKKQSKKEKNEKNKEHDAVCKYLDSLHDCIKGKIDTACGSSAGSSFEKYSSYLLSLMGCKLD